VNTFLCAVLLATAALLPAGCNSSDRAGRLLTMAGEEAANISNSLDRFSRQLNIAYTQLRTDRKPDSVKTLLLARDTLNGAKKDDFDDFHRIAAWTAISQLSRQAGDRDLALKSSDNALAALNDVKPASERPQYVLSLAGELAELRGKPAAIELLDSGGTWAADIRDPGTRRTALVAFADRLINYDAYDDARKMLRQDPDASWRTDTFLALANGYSAVYGQMNASTNFRGIAQERNVFAGAAGGRGGAMDAAKSTQTEVQSNVGNLNFGKDVRFESVYQQSH
jgi:hypothetical protein